MRTRVRGNHYIIKSLPGICRYTLDSSRNSLNELFFFFFCLVNLASYFLVNSLSSFFVHLLKNIKY